MLRVLVIIMLMSASAVLAHGWRDAGRQSANLAPSPAVERGAVIHAYAARLWGVRGWFADHTWIAVKPQNADAYTVYEVIGWRLHSGLPVLRIAQDIPDRHWFGHKPRLLLEVRGDRAQSLIAPIAEAARTYPYADQYRAFPGPNSNTFTAWIAEKVPQLGLKMPWRAVGKGYVRRALAAVDSP